jgi:hypothetical protein
MTHIHYSQFNMTGSVYQMVNGVVLIVVFFVVRLYYGVQISWQFYQDILFSQHSPKIPVVLKVLYCTANVILMSLNVVWFRKLIASLLKRVVVKRNKD